METRQCPICNTTLEPIPRYPRYVCRECATRVADKNGIKLRFSNVDRPAAVLHPRSACRTEV